MEPAPLVEMSVDYEQTLCTKPEVFVYRIPPRASSRGYRAADWKLDQPDWTMRLRVIAKGKNVVIKVEDRDSGTLFAQCPISEFPSAAYEPVTDSSRYFVLKVVGENNQTAFLGIGFADRSDSFDLNVALQDHFKGIRKEADLIEQEQRAAVEPPSQLDLAFKQGQTITININRGANASAKSRPVARGSGLAGQAGGFGLLPPPPSSSNPVSRSRATPVAVTATTAAESDQDFGDLFSSPAAPTAPTSSAPPQQQQQQEQQQQQQQQPQQQPQQQQQQQQQANDPLGLGLFDPLAPTSTQSTGAAGQGWVQF